MIRKLLSILGFPTPLRMAADLGDYERVAELLKSGARTSEVDRTRETPLHGAVQMGGSLKVAQLLIESGANVNACNSSGNTPLHSAALCRQTEIARYLLASGARLNKKNGTGVTPLHLACTDQRNLPSATVAVKGGAPNSEMLGVLIEAGGDVFARTDSGGTPLHSLCMSGEDEPELVSILLSSGAQVDAVAEGLDGCTPIALSVVRNKIGMTKALLEGGADPGQEWVNGSNLLHCACEQGDVALIDLLIRSGVCPDTPDDDGLLPADLADSVGRKDVAAAIRSATSSS